MNLVTDGYSIEGCFEIAKNHENILDPTTYTDMPSDGRKKSSILIDPNAYDKVEKPDSSNGVSYPEGDSDVDRNELLVVADRLWKQVYNGGFTYSSSSTKKIPISMSKKIIDCSSYVTWILYEAGYTQFGGYQLKTRDFMVFDWTSLGATVIDVKPDKKQAFVMSGSIKMWVKFENLRKKSSNSQSSELKKTRRVTGITSRANREVSGELDIRGMASDEAIPELDRYIDNALVSGLESIRIIHGKGTGVLRKSVQAHLRTHKAVASFRLGTFGEGENGVTIAELK